MPYPTYKDLYERLAKLQFDFTTMIDGELQVDCNLLEGGIKQKLEAKKETDIDLAYNQKSIRVELDGMDIKQSAKYFPTNGELPDSYGQHVVSQQFLGGESIDAVSAKTADRYKFTNNTDLYASKEYFQKVGATDSQIEIEYDFGFYCQLAPGIPANPTAGGRLLVRQFDETGAVVQADVVEDYGNAGLNDLYRNHRLKGTFTFTGKAGCELYLINVLTLGGTIASGGAADGVWWYYSGLNDDYLKYNYSYRHRATITKAYFPLDLANLLALNSVGSECVDSAILEQWKNIVVTSGDALRGIAGARLKTNYRDFYNAYDALLMLGMYIREGRINIVDRRDVYSDASPIDLGEVKNVTKTPARDYRINRVLVGYPKSDIEAIAGKQSFNNTTTLLAGDVTNIIRDYNIVSPYGADPYEIESLRINLDGKTTTDDNRDNKVYVLNIDPANPREVYGYAERSALDYTLNPAAYEKLLFNTLANPNFFSSGTIDFTDYQYIGRDNNECNFKITLRAAADTTVSVR
ncbi:MAG: hypothetical protein B7Z54_01490, partial [Sphingobacteriales bacterium 12-47-4]